MAEQRTSEVLAITFLEGMAYKSPYASGSIRWS
jgi:hypothetical protein